MSLSGFHPAVARWFAERFEAPTPAQVRGWEAIRSGRATLIAAPTGSGKTLAAFLSALDELLREGLERGLPAETRVVYVSPLKALSTDIHLNLADPRREIRTVAEAMGLPPVKVTAAVRTGDTPASERQAMLREPPHILVTTPESLYLLLTAEKSREMLRTVRTVIVDEIHAVLESRRGAHLALSLERLEHVAGRRLQRIGLSATQRPIEEVARFLVGADATLPDGTADCAIVDEGHLRDLDLDLELPGSPLEAVMSAEVWGEVYERLAGLIREHHTSLVFVNTRRLAERVARDLAERLGADAVTAHHGSLARETRLDAERRLKQGELRALVATASLELGIDIGAVDLVCQLGSPRRIATFLQRVGRSGHTVRGMPKGRLFPLTRDELVECAALVDAVRRGELDRVRVQEEPLDVLAQQIVAEVACEEWDENALYELARRAYPYRKLRCETFAEVVRMVARGYTTRRGRRGAYVHHDAVNHRLRARKGARMSAITAGGAIPDNADYRAVLEPQGIYLGSLNEDFAVESMLGDIFQLGNASWRILRIEPGTVRVADARGEPPTIPFWLGEAPARSPELSRAVSRLRAEVEAQLAEPDDAVEWLVGERRLPRHAAFQIVHYLVETRRLLGVVPTQESLVLERFFDESGGMQLVLHAPFGGRVNRAWGLALRKRFCRRFNFELQAAATEEGVVLSLGPQHSFPLEDVFRYLLPDSVEQILVQALLDAPLFQTRWRWNATVSLAVPRSRRGRKVPPQLQRVQAEDLLAAVFPDAAACLENIAGDREVPDHPLVRQTVRDGLQEAMDLDGLVAVLRRIHGGEVRCVARDTPEPSPLCHEILNAKPYAFLDDAPLEERRTQAVYARRAFEPSSARELGALDPEAIERVRDEAWPEVQSADELHDALLTTGFLTEAEGRLGRAGESWAPLLDELAAASRATRITVAHESSPRAPEPGGPGDGGRDGGRDGGSACLWVAAERLHEVLAVFADAWADPPIQPVVSEGATQPGREDAIRELVRSRIEVLGPTTGRAVAASLAVRELEVEAALLALEGQGVVLRGSFTPGVRAEREWCDRRLLARIHRYTLNRLRAEIEPVTAADFMRFLFGWQRALPEQRAAGVEGLAAVVALLDGFELPGAAWESDILPARCEEYEPELLDILCLTGRLAWGRLSRPAASSPGGWTSGPLRSSPLAFFLRGHTDAWLSLAGARSDLHLSTHAGEVLAAIESRGASFFEDLVAATGRLATQVEEALGELVALGLATADGFGGLRALLTPSSRRRPPPGGRRRGRTVAFGLEAGGRWSLLLRSAPASERGRRGGHADPQAVETYAWVLLRRYGVVFRRLLAREPNPVPWRDLLLVYRRLEARGDVRGGRFVAGFSGEQFALPEAVGPLRAVRKEEPTGRPVGISAADPLNLTGIVTPGERVPALATNRVVYRDGVPVAALVSGRVVRLEPVMHEHDAAERSVEQALIRRPIPPAVQAYLGARG
ncbi:MAG: DEAD/DEAH box helicase [Gemmatimonadetes bacterium]|nr:DEAD/DEAH box helicase [Gemmatimonadota bacterium]